FSATLSQRVLELAYEHMNSPELVQIEPEKITADRVRQTIYYPAMNEKLPLLLGLLRQHDARRTMVFVNTKRMAERLEDVLRANGINAQALSGDVPQKKRLKFLADFHAGDLAVLIATDVASRGLHIPDVSHVFNYDVPQDAADYVHRIGRTARAGASGDAITFACEEYAVALPDVEKYIGRKIPYEPITPEIMAVDVVWPPRRVWEPRSGPGGGSRGGRGGDRFGGRGGGSGGRDRGGRPPSRSGSGSRPSSRTSQAGGGGGASAGEERPSATATGPSQAAQSQTQAGEAAPHGVSSPAETAGASAAEGSGSAAGGAEGLARKRRRRRGGRGRGGGGANPGTAAAGGGSPAPGSSD
ncbi:MAG: hypothetical protein IT481_06510, partial [Gammaproteobacteria bacterium]|nr:hypothetical protein [Gammaproteobacteria bacterium]